jgi:hypothetical protein
MRARPSYAPSQCGNYKYMSVSSASARASASASASGHLWRRSAALMGTISAVAVLLAVSVAYSLLAGVHAATHLEDHMETQNDPRLPSSFNTYSYLSVRQAGFNNFTVTKADGSTHMTMVPNWELFAYAYWYEYREDGMECPQSPSGIAATCDWALMVRPLVCLTSSDFVWNLHCCKLRGPYLHNVGVCRSRVSLETSADPLSQYLCNSLCFHILWKVLCALWTRRTGNIRCRSSPLLSLSIWVIFLTGSCSFPVVRIKQFRLEKAMSATNVMFVACLFNVLQSKFNSLVQPLRGFGNSDGGPYWQALTASPQVLHWYSENHDRTHAKVSSLPTGMVSNDRMSFHETMNRPLRDRVFKVLSMDRSRVSHICLYWLVVIYVLCRMVGDNGTNEVEFLNGATIRRYSATSLRMREVGFH